jgi:hypothetical protein
MHLIKHFFNEHVLAQSSADSAINQWLSDNPLILGIIFLVLGGALAAYGLYELKSGVSRDKYGNEIKGGLGKGLAVIRLVAGLGFSGFGIYNMIAG